MRKIKIWLNWFSAKDARKLVENYSRLKPALKEIAKGAKQGGETCFVYALTSEDIDKLIRLGYSVELRLTPNNKRCNIEKIFNQVVIWQH